MIDLRPTIAPKSDQLNADDLIGITKTIKITKVALCADPAQPIAIHFEGDCGKPYKPGKSMRRVLINVWGDDGSTFAGRRLTLFRDEKVQFGGHAVGGIRISHMSHIGTQDVVMALTMSKASRKPYTVKPLHDDEGSAGRVTLVDRVVAFKEAVQAADTAEERRSLRKRAAKLFQALDEDETGDFVTTSKGLDKWFDDQLSEAIQAAKSPAASNDRIQADPEPTKPKRGRPSKAEMEARKAAEAVQEPVPQETSVEATTELPSEPEAASEAEFTPLDPSDPDLWQVLDEIDGPAPRDEHYTLADDEPKDGKLPVYENGVKVGDIGPEDSGAYRSFTEHPEAEDDGFPGDKPFSKIAAGLQDAIAITSGTADPETYRVHEVEVQPDPPGAFGVFWRDYIRKEASAWAPIKDALRLLQATEDYKALSPAEQNAWRKMAWTAIDEKIAAGEFEIDVLDDITAFRYWTETQDDPESLVAKYAELQDMALYEGLQQNLKDALAKAVAERIAVLEAP